MDILKMAKELGNAIGESEEMRRLNKGEEAVLSDSKAQELFNDYKLLQIEMVNATKENRDKEIIESIKERLMAKQGEINTYELTKEYLQAKSNFDAFMKQINDTIVFGITGEEQCSHTNCSSCGGGCK